MLWNLWKVVYGLRRQQSRVQLAGGIRYLTLRGIEWIHVWCKLMNWECFSSVIKANIFPLLPALWLVDDSAAVSLRYALTHVTG